MKPNPPAGDFQRIITFTDMLPQLPRLLLRGDLHFRFEKVPYSVTGISWRKRLNFVVAALNQIVRLPRPLGRPVIAQVEPANVCNLACPLCFTASLNDSRPPAMLTVDTFRRFIDELGDTLLLIVLWNWGEPFLNPELPRLIEYAAARGVIVHCSTNGNVDFSPEMAERIVRSGLGSLVFAIDGACEETYRAYRVGGSLARVKANLAAVAAARRRLGAATPRLIVRFVAMRHNEAEMAAVERLAIELGADFFSVKSVDMPPALGDELDRSFAPADTRFRRYEYEGGSYRRRKRRFVCVRPWKRITMESSGHVLSCEYDYRNRHTFGRVGDMSALAAWKSAEARRFRRLFQDGHNDDFYHCRACTYKGMRSEDCVLEVRELQPGSAGTCSPA